MRRGGWLLAILGLGCATPAPPPPQPAVDVCEISFTRSDTGRAWLSNCDCDALWEQIFTQPNAATWFSMYTAFCPLQDPPELEAAGEAGDEAGNDEEADQVLDE